MFACVIIVQLLLMGVCSQPPNLCMICELMTGSLWDLLHRRKEVRLDWKLVMRFITDTARGMVPPPPAISTV